MDTAVSLIQDIWTKKIASSTPVSYAKSAIAMAPAKVEELKAAREEYFRQIETTLKALKLRAVKLPTELTTAITTAIADARANLENAHLFDKVKAAYDAVLKYPAVVAVVEKTTPYAVKAVDMATPYYVTAKDMATPYATKAVDIAKPYVAKAGEVAGPYVTAIKDKFKK